ncbi:MAG: hypothetical protein JXR68_10635, partial [Bacteroidales bacterium]|nr:hypothetical protein [Bacteroidales bacterium]
MKYAKIISFLIFIFIFQFSKAQENLDTLQHQLYEILEKEQYDTSTVEFVEYVFYENIDINNTRASEAAAIGLQIANNIGDSVLISRMQNLRGISILKQKTYFMATQIFFENYAVFRKYNSKKQMANTLLLIAQSYLEQGISDIAGDKVFDALDLYSKIDDSIGIAKSYLIFGTSYMLENENIAIDYFLQAKAIFARFANELYLAKTYSLLAKAYLELDRSDLSIEYLFDALSIFNSLQKQFYVAETYETIGDVYYYNEMLKQAQNNYHNAKQIFIKFEVLRKITEIDIKLARVLFASENYFLAATFADSARFNAELFNDYELLFKSYKILADAYVQINDMSKAEKYRSLYAEALINYYDDKSS